MLFRPSKVNLFTLRERKSCFMVAISNASRQAKNTAATLIRYMEQRLDKTVHSLTLDNDTAFALHQTMAQSL